MNVMNIDRPIKVLLVEDDDDSAAAMVTILEKRGISVVRVNDVPGALREFSPDIYDAIVTDIRLPELSGVDLLKSIRRTDSDFPVIFVTAYDSLDTAIQAVRLGAQDYILKPLDNIDDLLAPLSRAVHSHRVLLQHEVLKEAMAFNEIRLRSILENSVDIVFMLNLTTDSVEYVSPSIETVLGHGTTEFQSAKISDFTGLIHPDDRRGMIETIQSAAAQSRETSKLPSIECRMRHKNGDYRWIGIAHSVVLDAAHRAVAIVGNARDITDSVVAKEREDQVRERLARDARLESLAVMAAGVAHDLNNMLGPATAAPDLVDSYLEDAPDCDYARNIRECMSDVRDTTKRAVQIVRELMSLSKDEKHHLKPVNLNHVLESCFCTAEFRHLKTSRADINFETRVVSDLPSINGSIIQLQRVIINLTGNACQAMPRGGRLTISTSHETLNEEIPGYEIVKSGEYAVVRVADSGTGINKDDLNRIFEPFFSTKPKKADGISGIGLAVVRGVIKDHHGFIDVQSELGKGTVFTLYFPVCRVAAKEGETVAVSVTQDGKELILLVDNMKEQLRTSQSVLRRLGYNVITAGNGEEAVRLLREACGRNNGNPPLVDLIILDMIQEQNADSVDVCQQLMAIPSEPIPVIISAFSEDEQTREAMRLGARGFLRKPYSIEDLGRAIRNELDHR
jgi:PAS domain S-box-containing protein